MNKINNQYSLLNIIAIIYKWRKMLAIFVVGITFITGLSSYLVDDYFKASSTFIPTNEEQKLFDSAGNLSLYGDEDAINRALLFAKSKPLAEYMIKHFNLADEYDIEIKTSKDKDKLTRKFYTLYNVKQNEYSGIELSIEDKDPQRAAEMVNYALKKIESLYRDATSSNKELIRETYEKSISDKEKELSYISDTLASLRRKYNIYDVESQSTYLSQLLTSTEANLAADKARLISYKEMNGNRDSIMNITARIQGNYNKLSLLRNQSDSLETTVSVYRFNKQRDVIKFYEMKIENLNNEINYIITQFAKFKTHAYSNIAGIIILEPVSVPNIKSYPVRSLIVLSSILISSILGILGILVIENTKNINWKELLNEESTIRP